MKNCTKCGKELRENDAYCPACGLSTDGLDREEGKSKNWFALIGFIFSLCDCIPGLALILSLFKKVPASTFAKLADPAKDPLIMPLQQIVVGDTLMKLLIYVALIMIYLPGVIFSFIGLRKANQSEEGGRALSLIGLCISCLFLVNALIVVITIAS